MAVLRTATRISSKDFTWNSKTQTFSTELSEFGHRNARCNTLAQIYDDACDIGFVMVSEKTGKEEVFAFVEAKKDEEGDLQFLKYVPANPKLRGISVLFFND